MEAYTGVRRRRGQNQDAELGTKGKKINKTTTFPSTCPSVGPAARDRGAFRSPCWGWRVPYLRSPGGPEAPRGTAGRIARPLRQRSTAREARGSGCAGFLGLPGPLQGAPQLGCCGRARAIASGARAPPLRPARPAENNRRGPPPASPATSSTLAGRRALCDDHSPSGPGRRRPRAPTLQCGTRSRPVNCARAAGHRAPSQPCSFIALVIWVLGCRGGPQRRHRSEPRERRSLDRPAKSNHETLVLE